MYCNRNSLKIVDFQLKNEGVFWQWDWQNCSRTTAMAMNDTYFKNFVN